MFILGSFVCIFFLGLVVIAPADSAADYKFSSVRELELWGYNVLDRTPQKKDSSFRLSDYPKNSLNFPVDVTKSLEPVGAVMHQFQDRSGVYYHAGVDLLTEPHQVIRSPVVGRIEAGYYSYVDDYDGSTEKFFLPLEDALSGKGIPPGGKYYFEVAVIDKFENRFEFHHVDSDQLSASILAKIKTRGQVFPGEELGVVTPTPAKVLGSDYHHLHYNIVSKDGLYLNPLYISKSIPDNIPPQIEQIYGTQTSSCGKYSPQLIEINDETISQVRDNLIIKASDQISQGVFVQPPTKISAKFGKASHFEWDFSLALIDENGVLPDLNALYLRDYCDFYGAAQTSMTLVKASSNHNFFIKVPTPPNYTGPLIIEVQDQAGNSTHKTVNITTKSGSAHKVSNK